MSINHHHNYKENLIEQKELNQRTNRLLQQKGIPSYLQARYISYILDEIKLSRKEEILGLKGRIKIDENNVSWKKAFDFSITFLKRFRMDLTLNAIEKEYHISDSTEFKYGQDIDNFFIQLKDSSENLAKNSFIENVIRFSQQAGIPLPKPRRTFLNSHNSQ